MPPATFWGNYFWYGHKRVYGRAFKRSPFETQRSSNNKSLHEISRIDFSFVTDFYCLCDICIYAYVSRFICNRVFMWSLWVVVCN